MGVEGSGEQRRAVEGSRGSGGEWKEWMGAHECQCEGREGWGMSDIAMAMDDIAIAVWQAFYGGAAVLYLLVLSAVLF